MNCSSSFKEKVDRLQKQLVADGADIPDNLNISELVPILVSHITNRKLFRLFEYPSSLSHFLPFSLLFDFLHAIGFTTNT
jgi:hypothetical protein